MSEQLNSWVDGDMSDKMESAKILLPRSTIQKSCNAAPDRSMASKCGGKKTKVSAQTYDSHSDYFAHAPLMFQKQLPDMFNELENSPVPASSTADSSLECAVTSKCGIKNNNSVKDTLLQGDDGKGKLVAKARKRYCKNTDKLFSERDNTLCRNKEDHVVLGKKTQVSERDACDVNFCKNTVPEVQHCLDPTSPSVCVGNVGIPGVSSVHQSGAPSESSESHMTTDPAEMSSHDSDCEANEASLSVEYPCEASLSDSILDISISKSRSLLAEFQSAKSLKPKADTSPEMHDIVEQNPVPCDNSSADAVPEGILDAAGSADVTVDPYTITGAISSTVLLSDSLESESETVANKSIPCTKTIQNYGNPVAQPEMGGESLQHSDKAKVGDELCSKLMQEIHLPFDDDSSGEEVECGGVTKKTEISSPSDTYSGRRNEISQNQIKEVDPDVRGGRREELPVKGGPYANFCGEKAEELSKKLMNEIHLPFDEDVEEDNLKSPGSNDIEHVTNPSVVADCSTSPDKPMLLGSISASSNFHLGKTAELSNERSAMEHGLEKAKKCQKGRHGGSRKGNRSRRSQTIYAPEDNLLESISVSDQVSETTGCKENSNIVMDSTAVPDVSLPVEEDPRPGCGRQEMVDKIAKPDQDSIGLTMESAILEPASTIANNNHPQTPSPDMTILKPKKRGRRKSADFDVINTNIQISPATPTEESEYAPVPVARRSRRIRRRSIELYRASRLSQVEVTDVPTSSVEEANESHTGVEESVPTPVSKDTLSEVNIPEESYVLPKENTQSVSLVTSSLVTLESNGVDSSANNHIVCNSLSVSHEPLPSSSNKKEMEDDRSKQGRPKRKVSQVLNYAEMLEEDLVVVTKPKKKKNQGASLEDIYHNRLWKTQMPVEKGWETIHETPQIRKGKEEILGGKKMKRIVNFDDFYAQSRLKRRRQKAQKQGWKPLTKKQNAIAEEKLVDKLTTLRAELEMLQEDGMQ